MQSECTLCIYCIALTRLLQLSLQEESKSKGLPMENGHNILAKLRRMTESTLFENDPSTKVLSM